MVNFSIGFQFLDDNAYLKIIKELNLTAEEYTGQQEKVIADGILLDNRIETMEVSKLSSIGMSDRDFNKMMCFECAFYRLREMLVGLPTAVFFLG